MNLHILLYLILLSALLTIVLSYPLKNKGPWNNSIYLFLALFLTSWAILLWTTHTREQAIQFDYVSASLTTLLLSVLLASSRKSQVQRDKVRKLEDQEVVEVITQQAPGKTRLLPGIYFWLLLSMDTILIILAYLLHQNQ